MMKKLLVVFLSVVLCWAKVWAVDYCSGLYSPGNPFLCGPHSKGDGNCTWYGAYRRPEVIGICYGNAIKWLDQARAGGLPIGQEPQVGSLAVFKADGEYGHVAFVNAVSSDGSFKVLEMGWNAWNGVRETNCSRNSYNGLLGFIFPKEAITSFDFKNNSPQGWTYGFDTFDPQMSPAYSDVWMVKANGYNPGVVSPEFGTDISTQQFKTLEFRALTNCDFISGNGYVYLCDGNGNWNHEVPFGKVACDGRFADYTADIGQFNLNHLKQLSIELTERADNDLWVFDHVKLLSHNQAWDFKGSLLGFWIDRDMHFLDHFPADKEWARFKVIGEQPRLVSPIFIKLPAEYNYLDVRYSVGNGGAPNEAIARAYFDCGEGISGNSGCWSQAIIKRNSDAQTVRFEVPEGLRGAVVGFALDFFDNADFQNYVVAINNIQFVAATGDEFDFNISLDDSNSDDDSSTDDTDVTPSDNGSAGYDSSICDRIDFSTLVLYPPSDLACFNQNDFLAVTWKLGKNKRSDFEFLVYWSLNDYQEPIANIKGLPPNGRYYFVSDRIPPGEKVCFKIKTALCKARAEFSEEVCAESLFINPNKAVYYFDRLLLKPKLVLRKLHDIQGRPFVSVTEVVDGKRLTVSLYDAQTGEKISY